MFEAQENLNMELQQLIHTAVKIGSSLVLLYFGEKLERVRAYRVLTVVVGDTAPHAILFSSSVV